MRNFPWNWYFSIPSFCASSKCSVVSCIKFCAFNFVCLFWCLDFRSGAVLSLFSSFCNHFPLHRMENKTDINCTVMFCARLASDEPCGHRPRIETLRHSIVGQQVVFLCVIRFEHVCERSMNSLFCCGECNFHRNFHFVPPESVGYYHSQQCSIGKRWSAHCVDHTDRFWFVFFFHFKLLRKRYRTVYGND